MYRFLITATVFVFTATGSAYADDDAQKAHDCAYAAGDVQIAACTWAIQSGKWSGARVAWAYNNRALAYLNMGRVDEATTNYREAFRLNPANAVGSLGQHAQALTDKGENAKALVDYGILLALAPPSAVIFNNRGVIYGNMNDHDKAIADFDAALKLEPANQGVWLNRGASYEAKGDQSRALSDYDQAFRLKPDDASARISMRRVIAEMNAGPFGIGSPMKLSNVLSDCAAAGGTPENFHCLAAIDVEAEKINKDRAACVPAPPLSSPDEVAKVVTALKNMHDPQDPQAEAAIFITLRGLFPCR
jgi:tetratricopeptide (TPR) repeat protein